MSFSFLSRQLSENEEINPTHKKMKDIFNRSSGHGSQEDVMKDLFKVHLHESAVKMLEFALRMRIFNFS